MIDIQGIPTGSPLYGRVRRRLAEALARFRIRAGTARALFADENGPKGGVGSRCTLLVRMPRREELVVEELAEAPRPAFDLALDALERRLLDEKDQRREKARRPKKYFVAKRLLEPGPEEA